MINWRYNEGKKILLNQNFEDNSYDIFRNVRNNIENHPHFMNCPDDFNIPPTQLSNNFKNDPQSKLLQDIIDGKSNVCKLNIT